MKIRLDRIAKSFAQKKVIYPTTLRIQDGSFTTLLGPSGCGKTTLLRMIAGLETPDEGEIWLDDVCVFSKERRIDLPPEKRGLGFLFQDFALWPHMAVFENVDFGLRARRDTQDLSDRVPEALRTVHSPLFHHGPSCFQPSDRPSKEQITNRRQALTKGCRRFAYRESYQRGSSRTAVAGPTHRISGTGVPLRPPP